MMPKRRNLLLIWTDEQRFDTMRAYGVSHVHTPNLDRLAAQSVVFDRAYCCHPVCTPSRGCILTGLWPHQHGATENNLPLHADAQTFAELLDPGYRRAYFGKWHLGDEIFAQHGFDQWKGIEDGPYRPYYTDRSTLGQRSAYHHYLIENGFYPDQVRDGAAVFSRSFCAALPYRFTKAGYLAREASRFLRDQSPEEPFALSVNFLEPHMPFFGPFNDWYDPDELPVNPSFNRPPTHNASLRHRALAAKYRQRGYGHRPLETDGHWRRMLANYLGLVTMVDKAIGRILDALEEAGLADNTLVVFTSDHGEMMGDHALLTKGVMYEPSTRVPLMVRAPWLEHGHRRVVGATSQIDLVPTMLDLLDASVPDHLMGVSRRASVEHGNPVEDGAVVIWEGREYRCDGIDLPDATPQQLADIAHQRIRSFVSADHWKLNLCELDPVQELYDLNSDPHELHNRFDDPDCRDRIRSMTDSIRRWADRVGDDAPLPRIT